MAKISKLKFLVQKDAMIDEVAAEALVAEMIEEMAAAVSAEVDLVEDAEMIVEVSVVAIAEAVVMAAVDEEMIVDMTIVVEVIAIVQEIGTGDTVVEMTKCIKSWLFVCTTSEVII